MSRLSKQKETISRLKGENAELKQVAQFQGMFLGHPATPLPPSMLKNKVEQAFFHQSVNRPPQ